ncbi:outer membrane lipoprotein carrier protein LolA [Candidatus Fermentibacterales bacterium]|nr:outer membrane lipoprotein carrier protein LolA [Candidatus Fermentibacterales bacterium]
MDDSLTLARLACIAALALPSGTGTADSVIDPVAQRLEQAGMLEASFVQVDHWALTLEDETSAGTVLLAPPNLFLLDYSDPEGRCLGYDGFVLYSIEPDVRQVILHRAGEPGSFLSLLDDAREPDLIVSVEQSGDSTAAVLRGDFGEGVVEMTVGFTVADSLPFLFRTVDCNGNSTSYRFESFSTFDEADHSLFALSVPEGYDLVDAGEM